MRRNQAPSQLGRDQMAALPSNGIQPAPPVPQVAGGEATRRYFSVVWCKKSGRKHKKWEEDAVMVVRPEARLAVLKRADGKELCRGTSLPLSQLVALEPGGRISFSGKDIEIIEQLDQLPSEEQENGPQPASPARPATTIPKAQSQFSKFTVPFRPANGIARLKSTSLDPDFVFTRPPIDAMNLFSDNDDDENAGAKRMTDVFLDAGLSRQLRPHQRDGILFLYECVMGYRVSGYSGAILCDEMGLGKTLQSIALIWTLLTQGPWNGKAVVSKVLILAPSTLVKNWHSEFIKWLGKDRLPIYSVDQNTKLSDYLKRPVQPVLIMSYNMFSLSFDALQQVSFDLVICDEGHRLKNNQTQLCRLLSQLSTSRKVVLTGTPLQNDLKELYALVNVVNPGILGTPAAFSREYEEPIVLSKQVNADEEQKRLGRSKLDSLNHLTSQFSLRRTQILISPFLPPKTEFVLFCPPSATQTFLYERLTQAIGNDWDRILGDTKCILANITQLRKVCNHPSFILHDQEHLLNMDTPQDLDMDSLTFEEKGSKLAVVSCLLLSLSQAPQREKIVLVSISTQVLDLLAELCTHYNYSFLRLDGSTSAAQRQSIVNTFNAQHSKQFILLLSSKAGGTGLNLIGASRILLYDMDWNPAHDFQAMSRVWRDGQKRKVFIYRLATSGTIEEKIFQRQLTKHSLGNGILDPDSSLTNSFQFVDEDLRDLFSFDADTSCQTHSLLGCECQGDPSSQVGLQSMEQTRPCQLSLSNNTKSDLITDLKFWKHIDPSLHSEAFDDPMLSQCSQYLSFVFKKDSNVEGQRHS